MRLCFLLQCRYLITNLTKYIYFFISAYPLQTCYSMTSRWQTAMLFLLKEQLEPLSCVAYDPLFASSDRRVLEDVGIETLYENNEGRLAFAGRKTLFFMPHCGRPLFNSVLYANRYCVCLFVYLFKRITLYG